MSTATANVRAQDVRQEGSTDDRVTITVSPPDLFAIFTEGPDGEQLAHPATSEATADAYCNRFNRFNRLMKKVGKPFRAFKRPVVSVTIADGKGGAV